MCASKLDLEISVDIGEDADPQILNQLTRQLHQNIAKIGVDSVERATGDETVEGVKGAPIDVNTLLVTLGSASVIVALIQFLKDWVLRAEGRKVKIRVEDKAIEVEYSPTAVSDEKLKAFVKELQQLLGNKQSRVHLP